MDAKEILRLKVRLLTEGAVLPEGVWGGRKGGAGPVGARYFLLPNGRACGVPVRRGRVAEAYGSAPLDTTEDPSVWLYDHKVELRLVPRPKFYERTTDDGVPYHKIALLHGSSTLATTVYQACRYWDRGLQCKFCTIPFSYQGGHTVLEKTPGQVAEVVQAAEEEGVITDILLTTGTPDTVDMGCDRLLRVVRGIREVSDRPIGVQVEPPADLKLIEELHAAGADAIGMHIEAAEEEVRAYMCPGKYEYAGLGVYERAWLAAVDLFGRGNVSTFILHGLGESPESVLAMADWAAERGVLPVVTPVRPAPGSQLTDYRPPYVGALDDVVDLYHRLGQILYRWGLEPKRTMAGCHRCGACTPVQEAFDSAAAAR